MKISPNYSDSNFANAYKMNDWNKLVEIFYDRLKGRYLEPIKLILEGDYKVSEFSGFSILALDCILIETLNQFYSGKNQTDENPREKGAVKNAFVTFLATSENFKSSFSETTAETFYDDFRNGLLHQAQTKNKSLIKIGQSEIVATIEGSLIIDREKFHKAIESESESYKDKLLNGGNALREMFIKKMKYICNIPQV